MKEQTEIQEYCGFCGRCDWHDDDCYYLAKDPIARLKKALWEFAGDEPTGRVWEYKLNEYILPPTITSILLELMKE